MLQLTARDWEEIYAALDSKRHAIDSGAYGPEDTTGQDAAWVAHILDVMRAIGPDGRLAVALGVAPHVKGS